MDPSNRMAAAHRSLTGLSVGDALGKAFFTDRAASVEQLIASRDLPSPSWTVTDDTIMAQAIVSILGRFGEVNQDQLAREFGRRFAAETERGYGAVAYWLLFQLSNGGDWRKLSREIFSGQGSKGNGGAMRVAPLGAYFADDMERVVDQARASAEVTHTHPEGQAGAIAVAVAAATWTHGPPADPLARIADLLPACETKNRLLAAREISNVPPSEASRRLGDGTLVLAEDTVPFALWCAAASPRDYEEAIWTAIAGLANPDSDRDTTLAIVGGVVGCQDAAPAEWLSAREPLD